MAGSMISFVAAVIIPACGFYAYTVGHFLREALRMRRERLSATRFVNLTEKAPERRRGSVLTFLPTSGHTRQRGAA